MTVGTMAPLDELLGLAFGGAESYREAQELQAREGPEESVHGLDRFPLEGEGRHYVVGRIDSPLRRRRNRRRPGYRREKRRRRSCARYSSLRPLLRGDAASSAAPRAAPMRPSTQARRVGPASGRPVRLAMAFHRLHHAPPDSSASRATRPAKPAAAKRALARGQPVILHIEAEADREEEEAAPRRSRRSTRGERSIESRRSHIQEPEKNEASGTRSRGRATGRAAL